MSLAIPRTGRSRTKNDSSPDALMEWECLLEQIDNADNYWICTLRPDGSSHAESVWGAMLDDSFYFASGQRSIKNHRIAQSAEIAVHMESGDDTIIMEGQAAMINELAIAERLAPIYASKYFNKPKPTELLRNGLYRIEPSLVLAWKASDFSKMATRWEFKKKKAS